MGHETIFPPALERLMGLLGRQRGAAVLVVGYALCLCRNVQSLLGAVKAPAAN